MIRKFFRYWLIAALLGPNSALALNVGEIQVQSALNQLFDARIPLPSLTPEQLNRISVKLAPLAMFEEFGLDHASILKHLVFSLQYDADGEVYVKVISTQPIREPSLALLLEFGWPRGRTFREYTVLLDPVRRLAARPQDRTLTVLDSPDEAGTTLDAVATAETTDWTGEWWFPPETPSTSTPAYQPGDTYGPVAPGEGLWGVALKVRPDPNITREHMMQALLEANPQAFTSAGVNGLRSGVLLRIPTFQEIADLTGSTAARQRAEAERPTILAASSSASAPMASEPLVDGDLQVFPLAPVPAFEPTPVEAPSPAIPDESLAVESEPAEPEPVSTPIPASEPALKSEPVVMEGSEPEPVVMEGSEPEPVVMEESELAPELKAESALVVALEPVESFPLPVSATPLLLIAVSEMTASLTQIPLASARKPLSPALLAAAGSIEAPPVQTSTIPTADPLLVATEPAMEAAEILIADSSTPTAIPESASSLTTPLLMDGVDWLVAIEQRIPQVALDWPVLPTPKSVSLTTPLLMDGIDWLVAIEQRIPQVALDWPVLPTPEPASSLTTPLLMDGIDWLVAIEQRIPQVALDWPVLPTPEPASSLTTPLLMDGIDWLVAIEQRIPQVALDWPVLPTEPMKAELAAEPLEVAEPLEAAEQAAPAVGEESQYGPVAPNERLWTIAAKLRPDPSISTNIMVQALFAANPQAFSEGNMDLLKVDAILRIPTLREIVEYTGSRAAQQLLELDQQNQALPAPANGEEVGSE